MLTVRDLAASVGGDPPRWLFRGLELTVGSGQVWTVVGPNGSGKSTLLRILAGVQLPARGWLRLGGADMVDVPRRQRARTLAYLPQLTTLYHDLPARELVMLGRAPYRSRFAGPSREDARRVDHALERVSAEGLADRLVSTLSGGERQRVMLARLLATEAKVLLLDEPTTALDIGHALRLLDLCRDLAADGTAVVLALHELELARRYADHAICLGIGDGEHRLGPTSAVLNPEILSRAFDVQVREREGELSFFPR